MPDVLEFGCIAPDHLSYGSPGHFKISGYFPDGFLVSVVGLADLSDGFHYQHLLWVSPLPENPESMEELLGWVNFGRRLPLKWVIIACRFTHAAAVVHNDVLPQYEQWGLEVSAILTDNGREYCGKDHHAFELYLALNDIKHRTTKVKSPQTNGFAERFNRTILDEFLRPSLRQKLYSSVEALQEALDVWMKHYNEEP